MPTENTTPSREALAFAAHAAMIRTEIREPGLKDNPFWTMLRQDAFERFAIHICGGVK